MVRKKGGNMSKEEIQNKYVEKIKEIYAYVDDNEVAHARRDAILIELIKELGYDELAKLFDKVEDDIGFWYA